ncbi:MAG: glutaminyl-tRNA synthase (glutamine-hydrolyzing) subunit A [Bacteroidetes bacterium RIFCSPLOWO2_02_FULL_36_8]|nr:MAG: glutaminyl-tRNA synthase (glutamine-hydrolyzing) subunit A [Bacteroidetes bacterium RIFCSPLOWO2_02_FULL_36_8]OFY72058.1 MAG: glutaminyl-tRNA synthase (glutamine-hydrolyzing) subunit A [Bacteroidetes bacterium RIFCSPLOWO2_12_FULL_37_12]
MTHYLSISEIQKDLREKRITCVELVNYFLTRIKELKHLNAFLDVYEEEAISHAKKSDEKIKNGQMGRLTGLVMGLKDVICYKNHPVQASSKILNGFHSIYNATAVERLLNEDVNIIGRLNCDEFAMGASNENSAFGHVHNFVDETRVSGGSSGGSAVAVQANLCHAALGSDTGGSVRQPASFCGIVGLKPTYSRISRYGLIAYASSFDIIGTLTKSVEDAALLLEIMAGKDEYDSTVSSSEVQQYSKEILPAKKYKIAYIKDYLENPAINFSIRRETENFISLLKDRKHTIEGVDFPFLDYMVPTYYLLTTAEASANLARYDGLRYGQRAEGIHELENLYKKSRTEGFGEEVKRRIMLGTFVLSEGFQDAYFTKAQKVRRVIKDKTMEILADYDFILTPTTPSTAFKLGEHTQDPVQMYLQDIFTVQASLAGIPAVSFPFGKDDDNLPIGLQLMGREFCEGDLLNLVNQFVNCP